MFGSPHNSLKLEVNTLQETRLLASPLWQPHSWKYPNGPGARLELVLQEAALVIQGPRLWHDGTICTVK